MARIHELTEHEQTTYQWFGCQHPERPYDPERTIYIQDCRNCLLHAEVAVRNGFADATKPKNGDATLAEWLAHQQLKMEERT